MKTWWKILDGIAILMLAVSLTISGCCGCNNYKYYIKQGNSAYATTEYTKDSNGCITFVSLTGDKVTICGAYSIEENKNYKPKKSDNPKFR